MSNAYQTIGTRSIYMIPRDAGSVPDLLSYLYNARHSVFADTRAEWSRRAIREARAVRSNNAAAACLHHDRDNYIRECRTHDAADMAERWHKYRPIGSHPDPYRVER